MPLHKITLYFFYVYTNAATPKIRLILAKETVLVSQVFQLTVSAIWNPL